MRPAVLPPRLGTRRVLAIATVAQSLKFQTPSAWPLLVNKGLDITYAAAPDEWYTELEQTGRFEAIRGARNVRPASMACAFLDIRRLLRRHWALVQVQSPVVAFLARLAPSSSPLIYIAHGFHFHPDGAPLSNAVFSLAERALAGRCDGVGVVSGEDFATAKRMGFHRRTCLWRLPGAGVDLDRFRLTPPEDTGTLRLLFIGELNANKDPARFLDVVRALRQRGTNVVGTIVGDGPLSALVQTAVHADPLALRWLRRTDAPEDLLRDCHIVLLPSRREGLPRVIVEALATGRPVVACSNRGSRELLWRTGSGRLMGQASTTDDWVRAVLDLQHDPPPGGAMRASVKRYSLGAFDRSYSRFVDTVLTQASPRGAFDLEDQRE